MKVEDMDYDGIVPMSYSTDSLLMKAVENGSFGLAMGGEG
jgi:hypothetical protein